MLITKGNKAKYQQFAEHIRSQIDSGELKTGDRMPPHRTLIKEYGLGQATIDRFYKQLEKDGYIERMERKGIFVTPPEKRKSEAAGNLMNRSVLVVSTGPAMPLENHKQTGWLYFLALGAISELRMSTCNAMSLDPANISKSDIEYWMQHPPAGVVMIGDLIASPAMLDAAERFKSVGVPIVLYGDEPELRDFDRVVSDHEQGNYELTKWLLERGCRRILPVRKAGIYHSWLQMRDRGYERAMSEAGIAPLSPCLHPGYWNALFSREFDSAVDIVAKSLAAYIAENGTIDAVMAITDGDINVRAAACRMLGMEPNRDVLFVGYDHYWEDVKERAFEKTAPLATVDKRNLEIGAQLVQLLNDRIAGRVDEAPQCRKVAPQLLTF